MGKSITGANVVADVAFASAKTAKPLFFNDVVANNAANDKKSNQSEPSGQLVEQVWLQSDPPWIGL
ncbi:hypothetical protein PCASD_02659 [Puccinia coronata f. sp. avenae]|uniref:Uncharacterized protein n=1 Tax=Puccinia coronata f. sp. avenae TaxID=200324 RepID=A0A2N5VH89_9BASI|nr:hypothetical protein PCASD_02659 [Puccinia coronata f. sp. avenae]